MIVKTITSHDVYNYGASLQAYALMTYLESIGHNTEIIDYKPDYVLRRYDYRWVNPESAFHKFRLTRIIYRILKYIQRQTTLKRKKTFDRFTKQYLKTTQTYHNNEELINNTPKADAYIVGSDQVWNSFYDAGKDPAFYLDFVPETKKRISYAASFSITEIESQYQNFIKQHLDKFNHISVREYHALKILQQMNLKGEWVVDPIFLLPFSFWKSHLTAFQKKEKYILVYDFERNSLLKTFAQFIAKNKNMKIYSINDTYPLWYANRNFNHAGPLEFISLIYHADYFISNSFHGSAFSLLFNKEFFIFGRNRHKVNSRMESLLKMLCIENRFITSTDDFSQLNTPINYAQVNSLLEEKIKLSKNYLKTSLS